MLLTKESDYGIRIIRTLSSVNDIRTVREICDAEHIPNQYAYKILKRLEKAGFVQSLRGRDGGYRLAKSVKSFTLYDVINALDGDFAVFECLRDDNHCVFKDSESPCSVHLEFDRLQNLLVDEMQRVTFNKLLE